MALSMSGVESPPARTPSPQEPPPHQQRLFQPPAEFSRAAHIGSLTDYRAAYERSISEPDEFWREAADELIDWHSQPDGWRQAPVLRHNLDPGRGRVYCEWFRGWRLNACHNALDRHVAAGLGDRVCLHWEANEPDGSGSSVTYAQMLGRVRRLAAELAALGVGRGDRVGVYMAAVPQQLEAMLACVRLGAVHVVVFAGYSAESLAERLLDAGGVRALLTCDYTWRGHRRPLAVKAVADAAMRACAEAGAAVPACLVLRRAPDLPLDMAPGRDRLWPTEETPPGDGAEDPCPPVWVDAEDPLFALHTSGSTGKPKGIVHSTGGYLVFAALTCRLVFDMRSPTVHWCTADLGWITGHTYLVYGPLLLGATCVMLEGPPCWPDPARCWRVVDRYQVASFYTAPTLLRTLMRAGDAQLAGTDRGSLRVLGCVGEPINPEAWLWLHDQVGGGRCPVVDTYWQTETGGHVISPLPGATPTKPGSACLPMLGVRPVLLDPETGRELEGAAEGHLAFAAPPWPGLARTVLDSHSRYELAYFSAYPGYYCCGDGARRDSDGYLWITGRVDDAMNVSGHLLSSAQLEAALLRHPAVSEAAVVGRPHDLKGESACAFVVLADGGGGQLDLAGMRALVRERIGPFAVPDHLVPVPALPKTRSGKVMRRLLRLAAVGNDDFGDVSALAEPACLAQLLAAARREIRGGGEEP